MLFKATFNQEFNSAYLFSKMGCCIGVRHQFDDFSSFTLDKWEETEKVKL